MSDLLTKAGELIAPMHLEIGALLVGLAAVLPIAKSKAQTLLNKIPNPFSWRRV